MILQFVVELALNLDLSQKMNLEAIIEQESWNHWLLILIVAWIGLSRAKEVAEALAIEWKLQYHLNLHSRDCEKCCFLRKEALSDSFAHHFLWKL